MMRIITGIAKGVRLDTLPGDNTRPTSERVKEAIFSSLQFELSGRRVLDLFAGSGQMGLEAMSRGAECAMFVDAAPEAMAVVKANAKKTGFFDRCRYLISDYRSYIRKGGKRETWDLIFIDPPYGMEAVGDAIERIVSAGLAAPGCLLVCEGGSPDPLSEKEELKNRFTVLKDAKYGISYVTILRWEGVADA